MEGDREVERKEEKEIEQEQERACACVWCSVRVEYSCVHECACVCVCVSTCPKTCTGVSCSGFHTLTVSSTDPVTMRLVFGAQATLQIESPCAFSRVDIWRYILPVW